MRIRHSLIAASLIACGAFAQTAAPPVDDSLYRDFGGQPGLVKLMDDLMDRLIADPRMNPFFRDADQKHIKAELVDQFCQLAGGPCKYTGKEMKKSHSGVDITTSNFNALVEDLQQSMDAQGIAFSAQNRMLAKLAPMHREIVNAP